MAYLTTYDPYLTSQVGNNERREKYLLHLISGKLLERTIPDKSSSKLQQYIMLPGAGLSTCAFTSLPLLERTKKTFEK